jgi:hypothetical protein
MWGRASLAWSYHYSYDSGREGDMSRIGFSPRKGKNRHVRKGWFPRYAEIAARLGKHTGEGCLCIKRLSDVEMDALRTMHGIACLHGRKVPDGNRSLT